ncbi:MAG: ribosome silencing factor [Armatimonadota bacterium]
MQQALEALASKKAQDVVVLDLRELTIIADYFIIATGTSATHNRALVDAVLETVRARGIKGITPEGLDDPGWVLLDLGDVVVHIFDAEMRDFYQLERLWADAPRVPIE